MRALRERRELLKELLEGAVPATASDVIVILASVTGHRGGVLCEDVFSTRIHGMEVDGHALTAIQLTTACGICAALDLVAEERLPQSGFVGSESIALGDFMANRFGGVYAGRPPRLAI